MRFFLRGQSQQVFALYDDKQRQVDAAFASVDSQPPHLFGKTDDGVEHRLWRLTDAAAINTRAGDMTEVLPPKDLTGVGTVMLVEDEDPVRIFGARALRNKGYKVLEAKSGEAALELIQTADGPIDLLITDVVMPNMDGPALVREVREIHPDMKVIFISGYTEDAFRQRLDTDSDIHFLPKPFSLKQLAGKVKEVISGEAVV